MLGRQVLHSLHQLWHSAKVCALHPQCLRVLSMSCRALLVNACRWRLTERTVMKQLVDKLGRSPKLIRGGQLLMGSCLYAFEFKVTDEEMDECLRTCTQVRHEVQSMRNSSISVAKNDTARSDWKLMVQRGDILVWRRPFGTVFEYRIFGTYNDISPRAFAEVLDDIEARREWDNMVIDLRYLSRDHSTSTDLIRWVSHFPRPMRPREYIYKRRCNHYQQSNAIVIISRSVASDFGQVDLDSSTVRVCDYKSDMVIWPHAGLSDKGFDYVLSYYDDPQSSVPSFAYNWAASSGLPDYMSKLHQVTKQRSASDKNAMEHSGDSDRDSGSGSSSSSSSSFSLQGQAESMSSAKQSQLQQQQQQQQQPLYS